MNKTIYSIIYIILLILLVIHQVKAIQATTEQISSIPTLPEQFYGQVTCVNGQNVQDNTQITIISNNIVQVVTNTTNGLYGYDSMILVDNTTQDSLVFFEINGSIVQSTTFTSQIDQNLSIQVLNDYCNSIVVPFSIGNGGGGVPSTNQGSIIQSTRYPTSPALAEHPLTALNNNNDIIVIILVFIGTFIFFKFFK